MPSANKCPKCGLDLTDTTAATCPVCGIVPVTRPSTRIWLAALVQIVFMATFMFVFRFPKIMIAGFVVVVLLLTALSVRMKAKSVMVRTAPPRPLAHPTLFRIFSAAIGLCAIAFFSSLLFGFVIFMNSWNRWHQYEGQRYHQSDFVVGQVYFRKGLKGAVDAYASGTVEGQREWMNLIPYLHVVPRSEAQLDSLVGPGITIPIFYYPGLKGRARVQFDDGIPPNEEGRRDAMNALKYGFLGFAVSGGMILGLVHLRRVCYAEADPNFAAYAPQNTGR